MTFRHAPHPGRRSLSLVVSLTLAILLTVAISSKHHAATHAAGQTTTFQLFPANAAVQSCLSVPGQPAPSVRVSVTEGDLNDTMQVQLQNFRAGVAFDLFTVERSSQLADGTRDPNFHGFGLAWYQSDLQSNLGSSTTTIRTILLNQIFGFDPDVSLAPTNTFHVGFWFNDPDQAFNLGCEPGATSPAVTPFNGDHHAGPLAFISRPNALTGLGPLCTNPTISIGPASCNP